MQDISKISLVNAPDIPNPNIFTTELQNSIISNIEIESYKKIPNTPAPDLNIPPVPKSLNINNIGNSLGIPPTLTQAPKLSLPKIPAIPATGESGISTGGGPKFLSDIIKKHLSIITGI